MPSLDSSPCITPTRGVLSLLPRVDSGVEALDEAGGDWGGSGGIGRTVSSSSPWSGGAGGIGLFRRDPTGESNSAMVFRRIRAGWRAGGSRSELRTIRHPTSDPSSRDMRKFARHTRPFVACSICESISHQKHKRAKGGAACGR